MPRLRLKAFVFLLNLANRWRILLFVCSIVEVKSLPKKCLFSGKTRKNPAYSSVTNVQALLSIFLNKLF